MTPFKGRVPTPISLTSFQAMDRGWRLTPWYMLFPLRLKLTSFKAWKFREISCLSWTLAEVLPFLKLLEDQARRFYKQAVFPILSTIYFLTLGIVLWLYFGVVGSFLHSGPIIFSSQAPFLPKEKEGLAWWLPEEGSQATAVASSSGTALPLNQTECRATSGFWRRWFYGLSIFWFSLSSQSMLQALPAAKFLSLSTHFVSFTSHFCACQTDQDFLVHFPRWQFCTGCITSWLLELYSFLPELHCPHSHRKMSC